MTEYYGYIESVDTITSGGVGAWLDAVEISDVASLRVASTDRADALFAELPLHAFFLDAQAWTQAHTLARRDRAMPEGGWVRFSTSTDGLVSALYYADLSATDAPEERIDALEYVDGRTVEGRLLRRLFSADRCASFNSETASDLKGLGDERPLGLAVYNVGQGGAAAVVDGLGMPILYFDLGGGCGRNAATYPSVRRFCWTRKPWVVLSHWDWDHYYSAMSTADAWKTTWIVPEQSIGSPRPQQLISKIRNHGGAVQVWREAPWTLTVGRLSLRRVAPQLLRDKNASGIVARIECPCDKDSDAPTILHCADVPYSRLGASETSNLSVLVASHHGGAKKGSKPPSASGACTVVYSYGSANSYGHPDKTVDEHISAGWTARCDTPSGDVLIAPAPSTRHPSCGGKMCDGSFVQTVQP